MSFFNGILNHDDIHGSGQIGPRGLPGVGFNLDSNNDYDMQNKKIVNVKQGTNNDDVVTKSQIQLLDGARPSYVVNDKAVIYSDTGSVHAQNLYLKDVPEDGLSNELRILTPHQSYENIHLEIPDLHNYDGYGGRRRSEMMVTSVDQTVTGKKTFQNIEVLNPTSNNQATNKYYVDHNFLNRITGGQIGGDLDMRGHTIKYLKLDNTESAAARVAELNLKLNRSGDEMDGDLILQPQPCPIQGNTHKAISYNTTQSIFLSRKETFPLETDINMNNNFIQNVATPTSSHQATNKGYCDYNFLNRQKGGVIMGPLSMNRNDIIGIPDTPKFGYSAVNKNYVDGKFVKKTGDQMSGDLDMGGNKINNVGTPDTNENDAAVNVGFFNTELNASNANLTNAYKQYVDHSHVSPSGLQRDVFRYLMEDTDDSSSENNIRVTGIVDFVASPHQINKKAYEFTLVKDTDGSNDYRSRIGFNLFKLPLGYYTFVVEYFPPEMNNVIVTAQGTTISIASQTTKTFGNYTKTLVKFHNFTKTTPDYIFINLHGKTTSSTTGHLIVYGVKGYVSSVEPKVYDTAFVVENGKMTMEIDIDLNGLSINTPFFITGYYKKSKSSNRIFLNDVSTYQIIPFDCVLKEIVCYFYTLNNNDYQITLNVRISGKSRNNQTLNSSLNDRR